MSRRSLPVAVRAWTGATRRTHAARSGPAPATAHILVIDTETHTDLAQALTFGCYRYCLVHTSASGQTVVTTVAEGLFHADDLPDTKPDGYAVLVDYARSHHADVELTAAGCVPNWRLGLCSRSRFVEHWLYRIAYRDGSDDPPPQHVPRCNEGREPATVVMFNAPFDLSRLAGHAAPARARTTAAPGYRDAFAGGFSLGLWTDRSGRPRKWRPRVRVKSIDSKRALKGITKIQSVSSAGEILDLRTLVFALTSKSHTLAGACDAFGVQHGKPAAIEHGRITPEYIDYCRRDVQDTTALYAAAMTDYHRHPINLPAHQAFSAASIAKAYLRDIGTTPVLDRSPLPDQVLGQAMSTFYGGRTEACIRRTPMPIVLCDFTSMYPTVDTLMGLFAFLTHERLDITDATDQARDLLDGATLQHCCDPKWWPQLVGMAQIIPDGDVLPVRAAYAPTPGWNIGINPLFTDQPLWYTLPDLIAAVLLGGKPPRILRAVRFVPAGPPSRSLAPTRLRGSVPVDPTRDDFFRTVVEQRQAVTDQNATLAASLKTIAAAGSYGIFAEMNRHELGAAPSETVTVSSALDESWSTMVSAPEDPGEYCCPPIAACITGAARLMLAMLERCVTDAGGTRVFADTDSMAIVANADGGLIPCPGGPQTLPDGRAAVRALTYPQVDRIRARFAPLNPYRPGAVTDILKEEFVGLADAISAKRYARYRLDPNGTPVIEKLGPQRRYDERIRDVGDGKNSEHGLGHLLNPTDPDSDDTDWIRQLWEYILRRAHGLDAAEPAWLDRPALSRLTVSSPTLLRPFAAWNASKPYAQQIKPFNFLLVGHIAPGGHPPGVDKQRFHLIAPYEKDASRWMDLPWRNRHDPDGPTYRVTAQRWDPSMHDDADQPSDLVQLQTYRHVLTDYLTHPEHKADGPDGQPCDSTTVGLLHRRTVDLAWLHTIGKETNRLDDVDAGIIGSIDEVVTDYDRPAAAFAQLVLPALDQFTTQQLAELTGLSKRQIARIRSAKRPPPRKHRQSLIRLAVDTALDALNATNPEHPWRGAWPSSVYTQYESILSYWLTHRPNIRTCPCNCGRDLTGRQKYASDACRKRKLRASRGSKGG